MVCATRRPRLRYARHVTNSAPTSTAPAEAMAEAPHEPAAPTDGGTVYLLHFSQPVGRAWHYLGWAKALDARLAAHRAGRGGRATRTLAAHGGDFEVTRTWPGGLALERALRRKGPKRLCPLCTARR